MKVHCILQVPGFGWCIMISALNTVVENKSGG
jgi:hypothetical protein